MNWSLDLAREITKLVAKKGHFRVASGKHAPVYFDDTPLWISAYARPVAEELAKRFVIESTTQTIIVGPATGGGLLAELVAEVIGTSFLVIKKPEGSLRCRIQISK